MERNIQFLLSDLPIPQDRPKPTYHDVFLSCSNETRKRLASHLCKALSRSKVQTLVSIDTDNACLKGPRVFVVLFSTRYGFSTNRLDELTKAMDMKNLGKLSVFPVFVDVEPYEVKKQAECFKEAFALHEQTVGNRESVERWRKALWEAGSLKGWHLKNVSNGDEAVLVDQVVREVLSKLNYSPLPLYIDKKATGINRCVEEMMVLLDLEVDDVRVVAICGPPGIGKTAIAKAVYNRISGRFDRCSVLENIGEMSQKPNGLMLLQNQLPRDVTGHNDLMIESTIRSTKVLVLFDGIDRPSQVDALESWKERFGPGSRFIITTEYESILNENLVFGIYKPKQSIGKHGFCRVCLADSWEIQLRKRHSRDWTQCRFGMLDKDPQSSERLGASSDFWYIFLLHYCIYGMYAKFPSHSSSFPLDEIMKYDGFSTLLTNPSKGQQEIKSP